MNLCLEMYGSKETDDIEPMARDETRIVAQKCVDDFSQGLLDDVLPDATVANAFGVQVPDSGLSSFSEASRMQVGELMLNVWKTLLLRQVLF